MIHSFGRATVLVLLATFVLAGPAGAAAEAQTKESQAAMTPDQALQLLRDGNQRFSSGVAIQRDLALQVAETSAGQYPFAAVLGCIDSRVPPELVFDTGIGDIFSARIAGPVLDDEMIGSLEFATKAAGARLIVVLGHTKCGAVNGACDGVEMGHLTKTLALLAPSVEASKKAVPAPHDSSNAAFVKHVTEQNVRLTAKALLERSEILAELAKAGRLRVVPAVYDVATGRVEFLE